MITTGERHVTAYATRKEHNPVSLIALIKQEDGTMTMIIDSPTRTVFRSDELSCPSCVPKIEKALLALPGVESARVRFNSGRIEVEHDVDSASIDKLVSVIKAAGYDAHPSPF